ncbi:AAA domain family protein, partial [Vibrio parahaemolyticus V-223/04]
NRWPTC